jgi:hypothetical protein
MIIVVRDTKTGVAPHPFTFMFDDRFQKVPTLSFDVISLAGDVIHNLRSALDHLANQLALVGCPTLTDKELRQIEFPIAETLKKYEDDKARKVKGMRPEAVKAIDDLKLYKGGNDPLWRLHELDNIDKHRTLFTVAHDFLYTSDCSMGLTCTKLKTLILLDSNLTWRKIFNSKLRERPAIRKLSTRMRCSQCSISLSILWIV